MTGAILNLLVNVIIVVLLVVTIGYCWILNRRIRVLQDSKGELAGLLKHFDESTQRASESIVALQAASKKIGDTIQKRAEKAHFLLDDLAFMIEKAEKVSNQLEASMAISRASNRAAAEKKPVSPPPKPVEIEPEDSWLDDEGDTLTIKQKPVAASRERTVAALEAVLERAKRRSMQNEAMEEDTRQASVSASRSKSEQELLEMIRSGFKG